MKFNLELVEVVSYGYEYAKIKPDIVPIAKGIGGGFPIGAVLVNKKWLQV